MCSLAHFLEDEGIATVTIALVREHAASIRPPRALWVPFMLGRPFGEPNNPALQRTVIHQALTLLDAESGPVLADADVAIPPTEQQQMWACPVSFPQRLESASLAARIDVEMAELQPAYDAGVVERGRTTVGLSPDPVRDGVASIVRFLATDAGAEADAEADAQTTANALRWWSSDVRAFYCEAAMTATTSAPAASVEQWFWTETAAGELLLELRHRCLNHDAPAIREVGLYMIGELESQYYVDLFQGRSA